MSQKYIDWKIVEANSYPLFRYVIIKAEDNDHNIMWKGFIVFPDNTDVWLENENVSVLRNDLMGLTHGR